MIHQEDNIVLNKSKDFALRIIRLYQHLQAKKEFILSKQVLRSGTSIGANYSEACDAESKADFVHKMTIALKEANETIYWLKVLYGSKLISQKQYNDLMSDVEELYMVLTAGIKTAKSKL